MILNLVHFPWYVSLHFVFPEQVDSYLRIVGEPKLPSSFLQIICWVLGEYGTADGKYSASYIIGKLYDVAEAHPTDDTVRVCSCSLAFVPLLLHVAHCYCACSVLKYYNIDPS
jgi:hypothetical protein